MKKREGKPGMCTSLFLVVFVVAVITYFLGIFMCNNIRTNVEDALAASNLASAVIDIQEYGLTHNLIIPDPEEAFAVYKDALKVNMKLDSGWNSVSNPSITGPVEIEEYVIYNVRGADVEVHYFGASYYTQLVPGGLGSVTAPNGQLIESTSVYSKITFPVETSFGVLVTAEKDKLVDVVRN